MNKREVFGQKINKFQVLRHRIALMAADSEMNRIFVYSLYRRYLKGDYIIKEASLAKILSTQLTLKIMTVSNMS